MKQRNGQGTRGRPRVAALDGEVAGEVVDLGSARAMRSVHPAYAGMGETDYTSRLCLEILSLPTAAKASLGYTIQGLLGGFRPETLDV